MREALPALQRLKKISSLSARPSAPARPPTEAFEGVNCVSTTAAMAARYFLRKWSPTLCLPEETQTSPHSSASVALQTREYASAPWTECWAAYLHRLRVS